MNALATRAFDGNEIRIYGSSDAPLFVASDVAKAMEYRDAANITRGLDDEDKGTHRVSTPSGDQDMTVITEAGLYQVIMRSNTERTKTFRKWVTHEVLPSIRKTGGYQVAPALPQDYASALRELANTVETKVAAEAAAVEARRDAADARAVTDILVSTKGDMTVRDAVKVLARDHGVKIGERALRQLLAQKKWIYHSAGYWQPYVSHSTTGYGYLTLKPQHYTTTEGLKAGLPKLRITWAGLDSIVALLRRQQLAVVS